jgi:hypothetical protein
MSLLFDHLAQARALLTTSPLGDSVSMAIAPLNEAVEILRTSNNLSPAEHARLAFEVAAVGQLLQGVGAWLASRGVLHSTYDCHAGLQVRPWGGPSTGGNLIAEG